MGTADRDYFRDEKSRYSGGPGMPPVTKWLLIANISIFVIDWLFLARAIERAGTFEIGSAFGRGHLWELLSFQFIHANLGHIVFNSIGLYFFGPWLERWWGSRRFIGFYLLCGVAGALGYTLLVLLGLVAPGGGIVGASAGIYGCMIGAAVIDPKVQVQLLFPPVTLTIRKLAYILLGISLLVILGGMLSASSAFSNSGGEAGHLGGAVVGYLLMRFPGVLGRGSEASRKIVRPKEFRRKKLKETAKLRPRTEIEIATSSEVDRILDKINKEGLQSLTAKEQEILSSAGKPRNSP